MKALTIMMLGLLVMSCKQEAQRETTAEPSSGQTNTEDVAPQQCFLYVVGKDSIKLQLNRRGDSLTGRIAFDNFEKDSSEGTISGRKVGDTLKLVYDFQSEGMQSKRELFFLENGGELRMGLGQFEPRDGVDVYLGPLDYRGPISLKAVDCPTGS